MLNRRLIALSMIGAMSLSMFVGCAGKENTETIENSQSKDETYTIGYCNGADSDVFMVARKEALIKATEGTNIDIQFADANNDSTKQLGDADTFIAKNVDMLILVPTDGEAVVPAVEAANEKGIPVICLGIKAASGDYIYVGSENVDAGYMQGEYLSETLEDNAKVLYLAGTAGLDHSAARNEGFKAALAEAGRDDIEILSELDGDYTLAKAMQITEDWVQKYPEFDAIVAANDLMALGAVEALKGSNRLDGVQISGIDGLDDAYSAIREGSMVQTILQDAPAQADAALDVINKIMAGEEVSGEVLVPFQSVTADNIEEIIG